DRGIGGARLPASGARRRTRPRGGAHLLPDQPRFAFPGAAPPVRGSARRRDPALPPPGHPRPRSPPRRARRGGGRGRRGARAGFRNLMTDARLAAIPKFLETPKDETLDHDRKNLATLRRLAASRFRIGRDSDELPVKTAAFSSR